MTPTDLTCLKIIQDHYKCDGTNAIKQAIFYYAFEIIQENSKYKMPLPGEK